jgi:hypothetical protein
MSREYRFNTFIDQERKILTVRPIGYMPGTYFVDKLFEFYARVDEPWTYNRVTDVRRFDGRLIQEDLDEIAKRWTKLADGRAYHAHVAVVSLDRLQASGSLRSPLSFRMRRCASLRITMRPSTGFSLSTRMLFWPDSEKPGCHNDGTTTFALNSLAHPTPSRLSFSWQPTRLTAER